MEQLTDEAVLLKIHRLFSKDESFAVLLKEIKSLKFNIGELVSENEELKFELDKYKKIVKQKDDNFNHRFKIKMEALIKENNELKQTKPIPIEIKKDEMVQSYKKQTNLANKQRTEYKNKFLAMSNKFYSANATILKLEEKIKQLELLK